jgi:hypothetical protein
LHHSRIYHGKTDKSGQGFWVEKGVITINIPSPSWFYLVIPAIIPPK